MNRNVALALALIAVFAATVAILSQVLPGPHKPPDYLAMGGVATLLCLALLFVVLIAMPGRSKDR
jgi:hypothetical protein